jgi:predicted RNA-binding Zn ribbon-like protein
LTVSETQNNQIRPDRAPPSTEGEPAPGELELVRSFINTRELDPDREEITGPEALGDWMSSRGIPVLEPPTATDVERAVSFREALRALALANSGRELDDAALAELRAASAAAPLRAWVDPDGQMVIAPSCDGLDALIARILSAVSSAQETGEWPRLKACTSEECLWAFYDRSKNRSRHWCSMEVCGNRAKTRAYRAKRGGRPA